MNKIVENIDRAVRQAHRLAHKPRGYLGASSLGKRCKRQIWYGFRWSYHEDHLGRLHRLFDRGHEEEFRFVKYLRQAGAEIRDYSQRLLYHDASDSYVLLDWDVTEWSHELDDVSHDRVHIERATDRNSGPLQWAFKDVDGHFGGHSDGRISWPGVLPDGWGLSEFKTSNDKSFKILNEKGVLTAKPEHWVQMQIYMHYFGLTWGLYLCVNKNDDNLYAEVVFYRDDVAKQYIDIARDVIYSKDGPKRLSTDPSWFECKFCAYREICHYDQEPMKNCRSCAFAEPGADCLWHCNQFHATIPAEFIPKGCDNWSPIK